MEDVPSVLFDEVMDEIEEETTEFLGPVLSADVLSELISGIQAASAEEVREVISRNYRENMGDIGKMILGEKLSRVVTRHARARLRGLLSDITGRSFDLVDELRSEVIGESFEET